VGFLLVEPSVALYYKTNTHSYLTILKMGISSIFIPVFTRQRWSFALIKAVVKSCYNTTAHSLFLRSL